jgi:CO/xanthine dehydrogenase FAD-binding subunit
VLGKGTINDVRVALTLTGTSCRANELAAAARHATAGQTVQGDIHADGEYRTALAEIHVRRALERAFARLS